jgi:phenylacetic acid degradation operon negative regulatory protein
MGGGSSWSRASLTGAGSFVTCCAPGSPGAVSASSPPGLWVSPHPGRQPEVRRVLEDVGLAQGATFFVASLGELGDPRRIAGQAWNLTEIQARYQEFIGRVQRLRPDTPSEMFAAQVRLVQEWRRFPLLDPGLPAELLPELWTGAEAAAVFRARKTAWKPAADAAWREFAAT